MTGTWIESRSEMEIFPQTVSGSWRLRGSLQLGCETWTGSFCLWAWIWRVKGSGTQSGYVSLVHGVSSGGRGGDLYTWWGDDYLLMLKCVHCKV